MKATGEVMSIGSSFEQAIMKAVRSIELGLDTLRLPKNADKTDDEIRELLHVQDDERIFAVSMRHSTAASTLIPSMPPPRSTSGSWESCGTWPASNMSWRRAALDKELYLEAKDAGFLDKTIERISGVSCAPYQPQGCLQDGRYLRCGIPGPDPLLLLHL